jgi:hypothetical protein
MATFSDLCNQSYTRRSSKRLLVDNNLKKPSSYFITIYVYRNMYLIEVYINVLLQPLFYRNLNNVSIVFRNSTIPKKDQRHHFIFTVHLCIIDYFHQQMHQDKFVTVSLLKECPITYFGNYIAIIRVFLVSCWCICW